MPRLARTLATLAVVAFPVPAAHETRIQRGDLRAGLYFEHVRAGELSVSRRLVVIP